ncbi:MAG TPA: CpaF family protein [Symbiobacteriaceae bacterium]|nr:CpaF family protein [Symbiobacteriaceae bacterium]
MSLLQQRMGRGPEPADDAAYQALKSRVRERLLGRIDPNILFSPHDAGVMALMRREIAYLVESDPGVAAGLRQAYITRLCHDIAGFGAIQPLIDDSGVTEIMVNRYDDIWTERSGRLQPQPEIKFLGEQQVRELCERIALPLRRRIDESNPILDGRLPDGSRVNAVLAPVALNGTCLTIRKFMRALTVEKLQEVGTLSPAVTDFLRSVVLSRCNALVVGGTSSGKTALLNALSSFIPADERIVTIEDAAELMLQQPHVVRMETRPPNVEGRGEITIRELVRNALRMRPDRIVVGECRGPEALDMMQAANTGHDGTFSTLHANSPMDALARLETMVLMADSGLPARAIRQQICSAFDLIIEVGRLKTGVRRILTIAEVARTPDGDIDTCELVRYDPTTDRLTPTGRPSVRVAERCAWAGVKLQGVT